MRVWSSVATVGEVDPLPSCIDVVEPSATASAFAIAGTGSRSNGTRALRLRVLGTMLRAFLWGWGLVFVM